MKSDFHDQIVALLPKLRIQALALTRHKAAAEDLVQEAVCNALKAQASFIPGTNFPAWMHRILRNRFISDLRRKRETSDIENVPESVFATSAAHEDRIALKELSAAMNRLPTDHREKPRLPRPPPAACLAGRRRGCPPGDEDRRAAVPGRRHGQRGRQQDRRQGHRRPKAPRQPGNRRPRLLNNATTRSRTLCERDRRPAHPGGCRPEAHDQVPTPS
jgi:RNA polymerase sigma factor (sigma-70 family)